MKIFGKTLEMPKIRKADDFIDTLLQFFEVIKILKYTVGIISLTLLESVYHSYVLHFLFP